MVRTGTQANADRLGTDKPCALRMVRRFKVLTYLVRLMMVVSAVMLIASATNAITKDSICITLVIELY